MYPTKKKAKVEEVARLQSDGSLSGFIRFEVENVSTLDEGGEFSDDVEVGGFLWDLNASSDCNGKGDGSFLSVYLYCKHKQLVPWRIELNADIVFLNSDSSKNHTTTKECIFNNKDDYSPVAHLPWREVEDVKKGFIKDDTITLEIRFSIINVNGIRTVPRIDFTDPDEPSHDLTLVIDGEKIYVSKAILATHSPVFKAMFYGCFEEKNKKEIELKEINREEFIEMLGVIYPSCNKIREDSVEYLLKLGDRFQITYLMNRVEEFLVSDEVHYEEAIRLADKYRLFGPLEYGLSQICIWNVKGFKESSIYAGLSDETKQALSERMLRATE